VVCLKIKKKGKAIRRKQERDKGKKGKKEGSKNSF
jgi:hypothetical protein